MSDEIRSAFGGFRVEDRSDCIVVFGPIAVDMFAALTKAAETRGFNILDAGLASALGATMVLTNHQNSMKLRKEHDAGLSRLGAVQRWLQGTDTGLSSKTMLRAMRPDLSVPGYDTVPRDADDFGRCYRLLEAAPELRTLLQMVKAKLPEWAGLIDHWDELEELYRVALAVRVKGAKGWKHWDPFHRRILALTGTVM